MLPRDDLLAVVGEDASADFDSLFECGVGENLIGLIQIAVGVNGLKLVVKVPCVSVSVDVLGDVPFDIVRDGRAVNRSLYSLNVVVCSSLNGSVNRGVRPITNSQHLIESRLEFCCCRYVSST